MNEFRKIISPVQKEMDEFENKLKNIVNNDNTFLNDHLNDFMFSNPKRLRPIFVYLFSKILKINNECVDDIALSVELIHSASLIHDDIIDEETKRRNIQTFYDKYGEKIAVLEGDLLLSHALEVLSKTKNEIIKIFTEKIKNTILGELKQDASLNKIQTKKDYIEKTLNKTANLFLAGIESLFCLKEINKDLKSDILNFFINYSLAFQIQNDIDNIKMINSSDIHCGNYTLPVIYFCLDKKFAQISISSFNKEKDKYIEKSLKNVEEYKKTALKHIEKIENSIYKKSVIELCNYTLRS